MTTPEKKLPDGWQWVKLGDVCQVILGQSPPSSTYRDIAEGLPFFQGKADFGPMNPIPTTWCVEPKKIAESGDILISVRAPVGPTNIATERCCIGRGLAALRCDKDVERDFLLAALRLYESEISGLGSGSTFDAITGKQLRDIRIPLPPLAEQQRIVVALEVVERARNAAEEMLEAVKALTENLPRKFLPLGQKLPHSWQWARLGDVCKFEYGASLTSRNRIPGKYKVFGSNGQIGTHIKPLTSGPTITIGRKGSVGEVNYTPEPCWPIDTTYFIEEHFTSENLEWLYIILKTLQLGKLDKSTAIPGLNRNDAYNVSIPLPPLDEQRRIVAELEVAERAKEKTEDLLNSLQGLSDALLRRTFSGGV